MIAVTAALKGYGSDTAEADDPDSALLTARTLADDIRSALGTPQLVECRFAVDGVRVPKVVWL